MDEKWAGLDEQWPGDVELSGVVNSTPLNEEQDARASALYHARAALEKRGAPFATGVSNPPSVADLIRVAKWIITGEGS